MKPTEFKKLRQKLDLTQKDLGDALDLTRETIGQIERGLDDVDKRTVLALQQLANHEELTTLRMLARKAAELNPEAGEIGDGMLRQLVELAQRAESDRLDAGKKNGLQ